ncbi:MAG: hypothetical protein KDE28_13855, partial [Anaerolineales bacterium]|nr:hypothetical protein [Anaerolineales bacterium]
MEPPFHVACRGNLINRKRAFVHIFLSVMGLAAFALYLMSSVQPAAAAGVLTVEIVAGYNLVVDSNVESPSTYAPSVATVMGTFCNTGDTALTGVQGFIGNFAGGTPGVYPTRDSSQA